ncbi:VTT domain-containing protein [Candidatus Woesearchaeota archaeon]|nr:VTT domain-containing protein [Candidatus Woesearchaeota archaeon]
MPNLIDLILHLDRYLLPIVQQYPLGIYFILFFIIMVETGLVITPFLPGDSLLFAAGTIAAVGKLQVHILWLLLLVAAVVGDAVNYHVGKYASHYLMRFVKEEHLQKTRAYFEKYGKKTIVLARFIPVVRCVAPFLAGIGKMPYKEFFFYNILGGFLWVTLLLFAGYFFGQLQVVKDNFGLITIGIIIISFLPLVWEWWKKKNE